MNSPRKYPRSARAGKTDALEAWAKLHCVRNLFAGAAAVDAEYVQRILEAIEISLSGLEGEEGSGQPVSLEQFVETASQLAREQGDGAAAFGFVSTDLRGQAWNPLFVRGELIQGLKRASGKASVLVVIRGLVESHFGANAGLTPARQAVLKESRDAIDEWIAQWTGAGSDVRVLYL